MKPLGSLLTICFYNFDSSILPKFYVLESIYSCYIDLSGENGLDLENRLASYGCNISPVGNDGAYWAQHYVVSYDHQSHIKCRSSVDIDGVFGIPFEFVPGVNRFLKIDVSNPRTYKYYDDFPR